MNGVVNGGGNTVNGANKGPGRPISKLKLDMPGAKDPSADPDKDGEKDVEKEPGSAVGMMSPESIGA